MATDPYPFHPEHDEFVYLPGCPACEMAQSLLTVESDMRDLSLDLWVAGWTPTELLEHVRNELPDRRSVDLVAHGIVYDNSLRSDHARPPEWRAEVEQLGAVIGVSRAQIRRGWVIRWIRHNADGPTVGDAASVVMVTVQLLSSLLRPFLDLRFVEPG